MHEPTSPLARLRKTLLVACGGLGAAACTAGPSGSHQPTTQDGAKDDTPDTGLDANAEGNPAPPVFVEPDPDPQLPEGSTRCRDAQPVLAHGKDTGFVRCADGALNRASAQTCLDPVSGAACRGDESNRSCETHADCTDAPHGFCMSGSGQIGSYCGCSYPCMDDSECSSGTVCMCPSPGEFGPQVSRCAPAECSTDADCASGECGATFHNNGCGFSMSLQCRGAEDKCRSSEECDNEGYGGDCASLPHSEGLTPFECRTTSCVVGRPLSAGGGAGAGARVATVVPGPWSARQPRAIPGLDPQVLRAPARAAYWLSIARMEHASVASFARFVHELMRLGAPPALVTDALAAAGDEVRHAERTFALASAYAGRPLGPGALRVDGLQDDGAPSCTSDLEGFVSRLVAEACVGETLGVAEALAMLELELEPALRTELEVIAADETRHAALAWRSLRWVAPRVAPGVIEAAFEDAIAIAIEVGEEARDPAHGLLGSAAKARARALALAEVVEPCRRALARGLARA